LGAYGQECDHVGDVHGVAPWTLHVHEEGVWSLNESVKLVLLRLRRGGRVEQIGFKGRHGSVGARGELISAGQQCFPAT
jgi:hypothetical protein